MRRIPTRLMCVAASSAALVFAAPARADAPRIVKGPYLQSLAPDAVEIRAELDAASPVVVTVTPPKGSDAGAARSVRDSVASTMHAVRVDGLAPSTRYSYSVQAGSSVEKGQFTTAPKPDSQASFTFLVYGDNRTDDVAHEAVVRAMQQTPGDFLVNTGDFVQDGSEPALWQGFFDIERPLLRDRCVFACVGNHELMDGAGEGYLRYFGPTTDAHGAGEKPKLYGSFRWANTRFFLLDAMESFDEGPERAWLDDEITRADSEAGLAWRIVVLHQGPWSAGPHGGNPRLIRAGIPAFFAKHHVDLVLAGHDHIYERGYEQSIRYLISGGGGAPLYPIREVLPGTRKVEAAHHFVEVTVRPDGIAAVTKRDDGSLVERCGFGRATTGWDCDPPPPPASPSARKASLDSRDAPLASASSSRCGCSVPGAARGGPLGLAIAAIALLLARARRR